MKLCSSRLSEDLYDHTSSFQTTEILMVLLARCPLMKFTCTNWGHSQLFRQLRQRSSNEIQNRLNWTFITCGAAENQMDESKLKYVPCMGPFYVEVYCIIFQHSHSVIFKSLGLKGKTHFIAWIDQMAFLYNSLKDSLKAFHCITPQATEVARSQGT